MRDHKDRDVSFRGSEAFTGLRSEHPAEYAAGVKAVVAAMQHAFREMGVMKSFSGLRRINQREGFDCPSCAWPDPEHPSRLGEFCENGAKALSEEATFERADREFFSKYSVEELSRWSDMNIGKSGRLTEPLVMYPGEVHYRPISWDDAFSLIAKELKALDSPDEAVFYTSGRSSNEAAFLYGLFARAFGTNNMPDCSNMCHESSGVALSETLGIGKGSVKLEDFSEAEVVMIIGQNPGTNHPRMLSALEKCKLNGGQIITINPLREAGLLRFKNPQTIRGVITKGVNLTDLYLQVKINQDVPLLKAIMIKLNEIDNRNGNVFDHDFISTYTQGFEDYLNQLQLHDLEELIELSGVPEDEIDAVVRLLAEKKKIIICWAMGLTQHKNGVENIKECVNLLLAKGSLGKPGAGTCPVRGHSNVQGDRSAGIMHYVSPKLNKAIKDEFHFNPPEKAGLDTVNAVKAMHDGNARVFIALGGNFISAVSDTEYASEAIQNCSLTVSVSTKLNRSHLITGKTALILPTLGRSEKDIRDGIQRYITTENSMGLVRRSKGILKPASGNLLSEPEIIGRMAHAYFGSDHVVEWKRLGEDYDLLRDKIEKVIGIFKGLNKQSEGSGFYLPNNVRELDFSNLPGKRAQFSICSLPEHKLQQDDFVLMTIRSHDQFNTTIYGLDDRYRGIFNERRIVMMNEKDMKALELKERDVVNLVSQYDGIRRVANRFLVVAYDIPAGNLAAYFPETNVLIPIDQYADKSNTPVSKSVIVKVEPVK